MIYPQSPIRYKHYGKNIERLVKEAIKLEDPQEREDAIIYLGKLMKTFYANWNKEALDDSVIIKDIKLLSGGELVMDIDKVRGDNLFEKLYKEQRRKPNNKPQQNGPRQGGGGGHRPFNKNRGGQRRRN